MNDTPAVRFDRDELVSITRPRYTGRVISDDGQAVRVQLWNPLAACWLSRVTVDRAHVRAFDASLSPTPSDHAAQRRAA